MAWITPGQFGTTTMPSHSTVRDHRTHDRCGGEPATRKGGDGERRSTDFDA
jgi:hypothetical protein